MTWIPTIMMLLAGVYIGWNDWTWSTLLVPLWTCIAGYVRGSLQ